MTKQTPNTKHTPNTNLGRVPNRGKGLPRNAWIWHHLAPCRAYEVRCPADMLEPVLITGGFLGGAIGDLETIFGWRNGEVEIHG